MHEFEANFNFIKKDKENFYFFVREQEPIQFYFNAEEREPIQFSVDSNFILDTNN